MILRDPGSEQAVRGPGGVAQLAALRRYFRAYRCLVSGSCPHSGNWAGTENR